jgi:hypothetical protein
MRRNLGEERGQRALSLGYLVCESHGALAEPTQDTSRDLRARAEPGRRLGEPVPRERSQAGAQMVGSGDQERAQLVEGGGARLHGAAAFEQEQAQVLAPTTTAGKAQTLTAEQPARGQSSVDQITLPTPALLAARALALVHAEASSLEEANVAGPVAPGGTVPLPAPPPAPPEPEELARPQLERARMSLASRTVETEYVRGGGRA